MSLKSKIEAVIYASEEPVTLQQLAGLLGEEAQAELDELAANQASLPLDGEVAGDGDNERLVVEAGTRERDELDAAVAEALEENDVLQQGEILEAGAGNVDPSSEVEAAGESISAEAAIEPAAEEAPVDQSAPAEETGAPETPEEDKKQQRERERAVRDHIRRVVDTLIRDYAESDRGIEIREVASGFRMGTKPEYHDAVRGFVKSLKPALKLTLPALETLAVVAYKQPVTAAEISEIRGVDSAGVLGGLMTRKLIATAGRKQVIGRPMLYKTTRDFLLRFGLKDVNELPSMEEFERMAGELAEQEDLPMDGAEGIIEEANARGDAEMIRDHAAAEDAAKEESAAAEAAVGDSNDNEETNQQATAESAAGGNDEEGIEEPVDDPGDESNETTEPGEAAQPEAAEPVAGDAGDGEAAGEAAEEPQTAG